MKPFIIAIAFATLAALIVGLIILVVTCGESPDPDEEIDRLLDKKD